MGSNPTLSAILLVVPVAPGFRLRAQTPAKRLKFESHPLRHFFLRSVPFRLIGASLSETASLHHQIGTSNRYPVYKV